MDVFIYFYQYCLKGTKMTVKNRRKGETDIFEFINLMSTKIYNYIIGVSKESFLFLRTYEKEYQ
ncbi:hypothetical protein GILI108418_05475 [Gillisia limnaea]|uniref:Uncharacterized protein n=1 Tax=Gillisia limnaea (strain DSM 15749 / LMG 21470 / R-8282) TaxID=865937 RepID=H2BTA0_GILLR|nr:hypothetical protein Gilli_3089 [Gillisia limnaea DSM 15749]